MTEKERRLADYLISECATQARVEAMDDRELVWWLIHSSIYENAPCAGFESALLDAVTTRLFPEYDGENVNATEWGWQTPEGPIVYVPGDVASPH